ncbi:DUF6090 family protein [Winogradskyella maritima]|uniref:DUF6090 family protein n=1 Tax=Winogradskyella maritima TaxID=1517766 RepID=A0ABV8AHT2_9FLAO|nr:DUF6090 family protein [Winogradskyella maritima]
MSKGKTSKYLKYAIGEIILVVIGILIALQINNWNNHQQNIKKEQDVLKNLKAEVLQNLQELRRDHAFNVECLEACYVLLGIDKTKPANPLKIDSLLGTALDYATFDARLGVVNDVISSGKLELIKDADLRLLLNQWTGELSDYVEDVVLRRNFVSINYAILTRYVPVRNSDKTQDRSDYQKSYQIKPIEVDTANYQLFIEDTEVDNAWYSHYINQTFVTINEEEVERFLLKILDLLNKNIND